MAMMGVVVWLVVLVVRAIADDDGADSMPVLPEVDTGRSHLPPELDKETQLALADADDDSPPVLPDSMERTRDARSGCLCRVYEADQYVTCFDTKKCVNYPRDIIIDMPTLRLSTTNIVTLKKNDLIKHQGLRQFCLEMNDNFNFIEPDAFNNMSNIVNVSISYNKSLRFLDKYAFRGLVNLQYLNLEKNGFNTFKDFTYAITSGVLPSLQTLVIASMPLHNVTDDDFIFANFTLTNFYLTTCQLKVIDPTPLAELKHLRLLDLSENIVEPNNLMNLLDVLHNASVPLNVLRLGNMGFNELPYEVLNVMAKTNITELSLTRNRFEVIQQFPSMPRLERLVIEHSVALNVTTNAFDKLPNLKYLYLKGNRFSDIPNSILLPNLEYLDISHAEKYFSLEGTSFANMTKLKVLNLSGNNIRKISGTSFKGLSSLETLILQDTSIFFANSSAFYALQNLRYLDLGGNPFPTRDIQRGLFNGLWNLETLSMARCQFENISKYEHVFANLTRLRVLRLEENKIKNFHPNILRPLINLEVLNLSMNELISWEERITENNSKLRYLNLNNNRIKDLSTAMLEDFNQLSRVDLIDNPFMCKCPDVNILYEAYTKGTYANAIALLQGNVTCGFPKDWSNILLTDFLAQIGNDAECRQHLTFIAPLVVVTVILVTAGILIYVYRSHIVYWRFLTQNYLSRSGQKVYRSPVKETVQYEYDAFVSYSNEDQIFVQQMVDALEKHDPYFKLCVYERDFQIGTSIQNTVMASVARSRKTVLVVSEAYIKSNWCNWEVQVAMNKGVNRDDNMVIIKLGKYSTRHLKPVLRYIVDTRVYLEWTNDPRKQQIFWAKLRNTLSSTM